MEPQQPPVTPPTEAPIIQTPAAPLPPVATPAPIPTPKKSHSGAIAIAIIVIVLAAIGGYYYFSLHPKTSAPTAADGADTSTAASQPAPALLPYQEVKAMSEADYAPYFAQKLQGFPQSGISQDLGFALLSFNDNTGFPIVNGDYGVDLRMVPVPNLIAFKNNFENSSIGMKITGAFDASGKNIYKSNADSFGLTDGFESLIGAELDDTPAPSIGAEGAGLLADGFTASDVARVEGTLRFTLPIGAQSANDDAATYVTKDYPFTLTRIANTIPARPVAASGTPLTADQLQMVAAYATLKKITDADDGAGLLAYMKAAATPAEAAKMNDPAEQPTADDMNSLAKFVGMMMTNDDPSVFSTATAKWTMSDTTATADLSETEFGLQTTGTISFVKKDGVWYVDVLGNMPQ